MTPTINQPRTSATKASREAIDLPHQNRKRLHNSQLACSNPLITRRHPCTYVPCDPLYFEVCYLCCPQQTVPLLPDLRDLISYSPNLGPTPLVNRSLVQKVLLHMLSIGDTHKTTASALLVHFLAASQPRLFHCTKHRSVTFSPSHKALQIIQSTFHQCFLLNRESLLLLYTLGAASWYHI